MTARRGSFIRAAATAARPIAIASMVWIWLEFWGCLVDPEGLSGGLS